MPAVGVRTIQEIKNAQQELKEFIKTLSSKPLEILSEEATRIQSEIHLETPVDTGKLQRSGYCLVIGSGKAGRITLTAGATAKSKSGSYDYAEIQHEATRYNHPNGGKAYYVRDPFNRGVSRIILRLEKEIKL